MKHVHPHAKLIMTTCHCPNFFERFQCEPQVNNSTRFGSEHGMHPKKSTANCSRYGNWHLQEANCKANTNFVTFMIHMHMCQGTGCRDGDVVVVAPPFPPILERWGTTCDNGCNRPRRHGSNYTEYFSLYHMVFYVIVVTFLMTLLMKKFTNIFISTYYWFIRGFFCIFCI